MKKKALLWFGRNLRINDNAMIHWAASQDYEVIGMAFEPHGLSLLQQDFYRRSALEIQKKFRDRDIPFYFLKNDPAEEIPKWVQSHSIDFVLVQDFFNSRDRIGLSQVEKRLGKDRVKTFFDQTLIQKDKLPFEISKMPLVFTDFRKLIEKSDCLGKIFDSGLDTLKGFATRVPQGTQMALDLLSPVLTPLPCNLQATESGAIERIQDYFWRTQSILNYKETRNGMLSLNDSSKISISLSYGCISARTIYAELEKFESEFGANESTQWFKFELFWRDYFKFLALKVGDMLFSMNGIGKKLKPWTDDPEKFAAWCKGQTGADFIDANMIELKETGWMSNRGRQNAASYLAKTLQIDWTQGSRHFEKNLLDYDTESNWGNWLYAAGVGTDPRDRIFNYQQQAEMYDADFRYRKKWLPTGGLL